MTAIKNITYDNDEDVISIFLSSWKIVMLRNVSEKISSFQPERSNKIEHLHCTCADILTFIGILYATLDAEVKNIMIVWQTFKDYFIIFYFHTPFSIRSLCQQYFLSSAPVWLVGETKLSLFHIGILCVCCRAEYQPGTSPHSLKLLLRAAFILLFSFIFPSHRPHCTSTLSYGWCYKEQMVKLIYFLLLTGS